MTSLALLDLPDRLQSLGAYAGFAAFLGLAVLALLYFAQSRELKQLREWVDTKFQEAAAERSAQPVVKAQPVATGAVKPLSPVARPGLASAATAQAGEQTEKIPTVDPAVEQTLVSGSAEGSGDAEVTQVIPPVVAAGTDAAEESPGTEPTGSDAPVTDTPATDSTPAVTAPSTDVPTADEKISVAEVDEFADTASSPVPSPSTPGAAARTSLPGERPGLRTAALPTGSAPLRRTTPTAVPPKVKPNSERARRDRGELPPPPTLKHRLIPVVVAIVVVALGVLLITQVFGGGSDDTTQTGQTSSSKSTKTSSKKTSQKLVRGKIKVVVLNGTTVPGLAAQLADQIESAGFKRGAVTNAADQQRTATVVYYSTGNRRAATEVAKIINVDQIEPMDAGTQAIAGDGADIVVTVGSDKTQ